MSRAHRAAKTLLHAADLLEREGWVATDDWSSVEWAVQSQGVLPGFAAISLLLHFLGEQHCDISKMRWCAAWLLRAPVIGRER